jgi:hypothetical protein
MRAAPTKKTDNFSGSDQARVERALPAQATLVKIQFAQLRTAPPSAGIPSRSPGPRRCHAGKQEFSTRWRGNVTELVSGPAPTRRRVDQYR